MLARRSGTLLLAGFTVLGIAPIRVAAPQTPATGAPRYPNIVLIFPETTRQAGADASTTTL